VVAGRLLLKDIWKVADTETPQDVDVEDENLDAEAEEKPERVELTVSMEDAGPCKKHVRVTVPRDSIDSTYDSVVDKYSDQVDVPGFRKGFVPLELVRKRFRKELSEEVKQRVLMASLEQLGEQSDLDPINEPNLDLDAIEIPEEGDFEYEFDVEVRPTFDLPKYKGLKIDRPTREIIDEDVDAYIEQFMEQYGALVPVDESAKEGDFVTVDIETSHDGKTLAKIDDVSVRLRSTLRFQDAELEGFDKFMAGASADDVKETEITVSMEADTIALRGETINAKFTVLDVKRLETPDANEDFFGRIGADSAEDFRDQIRGMLERQVTYEQRQSCRTQVMEKITESASWELPEDLVEKQVENALNREILEMQQSGFTTQQILARENDLRQQSLTMTRKNLKEHFVLDRIAEEEEIEVSSEELDMEITMMAMQRGENPRRVRARMIKTGAVENLDAQIRERKAVDVILDNADFNDVDMDPPTQLGVEALNRSVCRAVKSADVDDEDDAGDDE